VVERSNFTLDLTATRPACRFPSSSASQDWFDSLGLKYGDRIALDGADGNDAAREDVAAIAARHGLLLADGPRSLGICPAGRDPRGGDPHVAAVPGAPTGRTTLRTISRTPRRRFGCAINSNFAPWSPIRSTCCTAPKAPARPW
jgi:pilus assembly protein CpaD